MSIAIAVVIWLVLVLVIARCMGINRTGDDE
jgi:hypothetical protein